MGRRILIVEDEYVIAEALKGDLIAAGAHVVGPASNVDHACDLIDSDPALDATILDANLGGDSSLPVAERLHAGGGPLLLTTGYDDSSLPAGMRALPRCSKPYEPEELLARLLTVIQASRR